MGIADKVTAFTASDFGRSLASNGDGSDHGGGSHQFVVGRAVKGKAFCGVAPPISVGDTKTGKAHDPENQWHVGQGRLCSESQWRCDGVLTFAVVPMECHTVAMWTVDNF